MKTKEQIPAGSGVPESTGQTNTTEQAPATDTTTTSPDTTTTTEAKPEKDVSAMEKQLSNLEKVIGRQGEELGKLRKEKESKSTQSEAPDYDQMEAEIVDKLDAGELDLATAMRKISQLSSKRGAEEAVSLIEQSQQKNQNEAAVNKFRQDNPDYDTLVQDGALDPIMQSNPLHDTFSAYLEYKRNELASNMEQKIAEAKQAGEKTGAELAAEANKASSVIGGRGNDVRETNKQTNFSNRNEMKSAMAEALRTARGG